MFPYHIDYYTNYISQFTPFETDLNIVNEAQPTHLYTLYS